MTHHRTFISSVLLAACCLGSAAPALAESGYSGCESMYSHGMHWRHGDHRMAMHHKKLHDALALSSDQEAAWKKMMDSEASMFDQPRGKREDWDKLTTPERAEKRLEHMKASQGRMEEHLSALKAFYAVLTAEQKKTFDDFHSSRMHDGRHGKARHHAPQAPTAMPQP